MEQLQAEIEQLKQEAEQQRRMGNEPGYIAKMREATAKQAQLDIMSGSSNAQDASDEPFTIEVAGQVINLRDYIQDESSYQVIKIAFAQKLYEMQVDKEDDIEALTSLKDQQIQQYKSQAEAIQQAADVKVAELETANKDLQSRLTAATSEIDELNVRIKELEATQEKPKAPNNTDIDALKKAMLAAQMAKPAIYDYVEVDGRTATAKLLETDEEVTFNPLYKGKYRVATAEEVQRFREERAAQEAEQAAAVEAIPEAPSYDEGVVVPPTFQSEDDAMGGDAAVQEVHVEGATGGMESLEARLTELEQRVAKLEGGQSVVAA